LEREESDLPPDDSSGESLAFSQLSLGPLLSDSNAAAVPKVIPPELVERLRALEAKICVGGENLIEKAEMQEKLIAESEQELQQRREKEQQLKRQLEQRQAEILEMEDSYATL